MSCIESVVANHLEVFFRDVTDKTLNEVHYGNFFNDELFILMSVVMKRDKVTIIVVYAFYGNDRSSKIPSDVSDDIRRIAFFILCIHIEAIDIISVNV